MAAASPLPAPTMYTHTHMTISTPKLHTIVLVIFLCVALFSMGFRVFVITHRYQGNVESRQQMYATELKDAMHDHPEFLPPEPEMPSISTYFIDEALVITWLYHLIIIAATAVLCTSIWSNRALVRSLFAVIALTGAVTNIFILWGAFSHLSLILHDGTAEWGALDVLLVVISWPLL